MNTTNGNIDVCLATTKVLNNVLDFVYINFENEMERKYIMHVYY